MEKLRPPFLVFSLLLCTAAVAMLLLLYDASAGAPVTTRYVAPRGDCGGASPCYASIQEAVDAASVGETIKVAQGVYTAPGFQVVYIDKAITLTGGYTRTNWTDSRPEVQTSIIDAQNVEPRRGVYVHNTDPMTITLGGFTIAGGNAACKGGGVLAYTGTLLLQHSKLLGNQAAGGSD